MHAYLLSGGLDGVYRNGGSFGMTKEFIQANVLYYMSSTDCWRMRGRTYRALEKLVHGVDYAGMKVVCDIVLRFQASLALISCAGACSTSETKKPICNRENARRAFVELLRKVWVDGTVEGDIGGKTECSAGRLQRCNLQFGIVIVERCRGDSGCVRHGCTRDQGKMEAILVARWRRGAGSATSTVQPQPASLSAGA